MLTKAQASVVADELAEGALRRGRDARRRRLEFIAGPLPPGVTIARFAELVDDAQRTVRRSPVVWGALAAWVILGLLLLRFARHGALLTAYLPLGLLLQQALRRRAMAAHIRQRLAAPASTDPDGAS